MYAALAPCERFLYRTEKVLIFGTYSQHGEGPVAIAKVRSHGHTHGIPVCEDLASDWARDAEADLMAKSAAGMQGSHVSETRGALCRPGKSPILPPTRCSDDELPWAEGAALLTPGAPAIASHGRL